MDSYAAAEITMLDRESGDKKAWVYPITRIVLRDNHATPQRAFEVRHGQWVEVKCQQAETAFSLPPS